MALAKLTLIQYHWGSLVPLLDLTAGVFPVTKVDLEKDRVSKDWQPISNTDQEIMDFCKWFLSVGWLQYSLIVFVQMASRRTMRMHW